MDNTNPNWVWYGSFIFALVSGIGYWGIHKKAGHRFFTANPVAQAQNQSSIPDAE
jgi:hypothetical protein